MALGVALVLSLLLAPVALAAPPANDNFADAEDLGVGFPVTTEVWSNLDATEEPGEPFLLYTAGHSVWFKWEATDTGFVTIGGCEADMPITVVIFTGAELNSLSRVASGNDSAGPPCAGQQDVYTFRATEGVTYTIMVDGNGFSFGEPPPTEGEFTLQVKATQPPSNDDLQDAIPLIDEEPSEALGYRSTASGYTWGAGKEVGEPAHAGNVGGASVWYTWTPPESGVATVHACCGWPPLIGVYTGSAVDSLIPAEPALGPALGARVNVTAGTTYRIALDGEFDSGAGIARAGSFQITATMPLPAQASGAADRSGTTADVIAPNTKISRRVLKRRPPIWIFSFGSNEPGSTFQCKLDKRPFKKCRSSKTFKRLKPGKHTLKVRAVDPSGNVDQSPAVARFTVESPELRRGRR